MGQLLALVIAWFLGVALCVAVASRIVARYGLPWEAALMYFGVLPYPEEVGPARRRPPSSGRN